MVDTNPGLTGTLGEGPGRNRERVVFRVHSLGNSAVESRCVKDASVIGRVSVADASLSLSLSRSSRRLGASSLAALVGRGLLGRAPGLVSRAYAAHFWVSFARNSARYLTCRVLPHAGCMVAMRLVSRHIRARSWGPSLSAPRGPPVLVRGER